MLKGRILKCKPAGVVVVIEIPWSNRNNDNLFFFFKLELLNHNIFFFCMLLYSFSLLLHTDWRKCGFVYRGIMLFSIWKEMYFSVVL